MFNLRCLSSFGLLGKFLLAIARVLSFNPTDIKIFSSERPTNGTKSTITSIKVIPDTNDYSLLSSENPGDPATIDVICSGLSKANSFELLLNVMLVWIITVQTSLDNGLLTNEIMDYLFIVSTATFIIYLITSMIFTATTKYWLPDYTVIWGKTITIYFIKKRTASSEPGNKHPVMRPQQSAVHNMTDVAVLLVILALQLIFSCVVLSYMTDNLSIMNEYNNNKYKKVDGQTYHLLTTILMPFCILTLCKIVWWLVPIINNGIYQINALNGDWCITAEPNKVINTSYQE